MQPPARPGVLGSMRAVLGVGLLLAACGGHPAPVTPRPARPATSTAVAVRPPADLPADAAAWTDDVVEAQFKKADADRAAGRFADAAFRLAGIVDHRPDHDAGPWAIDLLLDTLDKAGRYDDLAVVVARLRRDSRQQIDGALRGRLDELSVEAAWHTAEDLSEHGHLRECGALYEQVAHDYPTHHGAESLYNAAACWGAIGDTQHADDLRVEILRRYPDDPLSDDVRDMLAHPPIEAK